MALIKEDLRKLKEERLARKSEAVKTGKPDALLAYLRKEVEEGKHESNRIALVLDELVAILDQNREFEGPLDFAATRAWAGEVRSSEDARVKRLEAALAGLKDVSVKVDSAKADWQGCGIKASAGCIIGFEAKGDWAVGLLAGKCGPKGLAGEKYEAQSIFKHPHGSLLLRVGETGEVRMAGEAGVVEVTEDGGLVSARCNDKNSADNKGTIELRVVLLSPTE